MGPLDVVYLQIGRGQFTAQAHGVFLDNVLVATTRFATAIRSRGTVMSGSLLFQHVRSTAPVTKGFLSMRSDYLAVTKSDDDMDILSRTAAWGLTVAVRETRWLDVAQSLGAEPSAITVSGLVPCPATALEAFERRAQWVLRAAEIYPDCFQRREIRRVAEIGLIGSVVSMLQNPRRKIEQPPPAARRRNAVASIEAYLEHHLSDSLTLVDLCRVSGLKARALQYAFREKYGVSPMGYLKLIRLEKARRLLSSRDAPRVNVTTVALECGFWHLAQFAQDYPQMFGERPSQTLLARGSEAPLEHAATGGEGSRIAVRTIGARRMRVFDSFRRFKWFLIRRCYCPF